MENTFAAFAASWALGLRYFETDVRLTRDRVPVLFHDARMRRVLGRPGVLNRVTCPDLPPQISTLETALNRFAHACFVLDIKEDSCIDAVAEVLRRTGAAERVCVAGLPDSSLHHLIRAVGPQLSAAMDWRSLGQILASRHGRAPRSRGGHLKYAHVPAHILRLPAMAHRLFRLAHDLQVRVVVWTVNDTSDMHRLLEAGADGIITDRPDLLREVLIARNEWANPDLQSDLQPD